MHLTSQERLVVFWLAAVLCIGGGLFFACEKYGMIKQLTQPIDQDKLILKIDVNFATTDQLIALPYIGEFTARKIVVYRKQNGKINSLEEIATIPGIRKDLYDKFIKYFKVRPLKESNQRSHPERSEGSLHRGDPSPLLGMRVLKWFFNTLKLGPT